jgi:hypothetical protein
MVRQRKTLKEGYKPYLCQMMAYINTPPGGEDPRTMEWNQEQLLTIVPDAIASYFKQLAYGTSTPGQKDMPTHCRGTNLEQYKKAISFYMPNKISAWDVRSASGNPTKSVPVNDVVNTIRKMECRKQGRPSCAKRDMKREEYHMTMRILKAKLGNYKLQGKVPTMLKFQFHIIARTDDITNLKKAIYDRTTNSVRLHSRPKCLLVKMLWKSDLVQTKSCWVLLTQTFAFCLFSPAT